MSRLGVGMLTLPCMPSIYIIAWTGRTTFNPETQQPVPCLRLQSLGPTGCVLAVSRSLYGQTSQSPSMLCITSLNLVSHRVLWQCGCGTGRPAAFTALPVEKEPQKRRDFLQLSESLKRERTPQLHISSFREHTSQWEVDRGP